MCFGHCVLDVSLRILVVGKRCCPLGALLANTHSVNRLTSASNNREMQFTACIKMLGETFCEPLSKTAALQISGSKVAACPLATLDKASRTTGVLTLRDLQLGFDFFDSVSPSDDCAELVDRALSARFSISH